MARPKKRRIATSLIFKKRDALMARLLPFVGKLLAGEDFDEFTRAAATALPNIPQHAVYGSCRALASRTPSEEEMFEFCWRLAGNLPTLQAGSPVSPWKPPLETETVPVQILEYRPGRYPKGGFAGRYRLLFLAGSPTGLRTEVMWSMKRIRLYAKKIFSFARPGKQGLFFKHPSELVRLRFLALVDAAYCRNGAPGFDQATKDDACKRWNQAVHDARAKTNPPCPNGWDHPCRGCYIGYAGADGCPAATHPRTYERRTCAVCGKERWHDAKLGCLACCGLMDD